MASAELLGPVVGRALATPLGRAVGRLPRAAARSLGSAIGELARLTHPAGRAVARASLAAALPELSGPERALRIRRAFRHQGKTACDHLVLARVGAVGLCRGIALEGWERLEEALADRRPPVVCVSPLGDPVTALAAAATYLGADGEEPDAERPGGSTRPRDVVRVTLEPDPGAAPLPLFGGRVRPSPRAAALCRDLAARLLVVEVAAERDGRLRLLFDGPFALDAGRREGGRELLGRILAGIERRAGRRLEQWPWMAAPWRVE
ncbi:MAG: hypothetical protein R3325_01520 [Thermoanaerobaculia bacterium]|nr:hypothetical protein [Thermoanaerobaculia bacterium]